MAAGETTKESAEFGNLAKLRLVKNLYSPAVNKNQFFCHKRRECTALEVVIFERFAKSSRLI